MKNSWLYTSVIWIVAMALWLYATLFAKRESAGMWIALALMVVCIVFYLVRRNRYAKRSV
jgi:hypothetical protein